MLSSLNLKEGPVLITGATGFVGRHLLQTLCEETPEVQPIALVQSRSSWSRYDWTAPFTPVSLLEGSVISPEKWAESPCLERLGGIFHLAAIVRHSRKNPEDMYQTNIQGLLNMIHLAAIHRCRVIFVSTSGTVGCFQNPDQWADEGSPYCESEVGSWPYYDSKIQAEKKGRELAEKLGVELVIIRPPMLLGPGDHRLRATSHILRMLRGKLPFVVRGGIHFLDIRDAVKVLLKIMSLPQPRSIYHLPGTECNIDQFFGMVSQISGLPAPRLHLPPSIACRLAMVAHRLGDLLALKTHLLPDPVVFEMATRYWGLRSRYTSELGFAPRKPVETMKDTIQWLCENYQTLLSQKVVLRPLASQ